MNMVFLTRIQFYIHLQAKPLLRKGKWTIEELLDLQIKYNSSYTDQMARMVDATTACVTSEESRRPSIGKIVAILKGQVESILSRRRKCSYFGNGYVINLLPLVTRNKYWDEKYLALAMLGVPECEDDDFLYGHWELFVMILTMVQELHVNVFKLLVEIKAQRNTLLVCTFLFFTFPLPKGVKCNIFSWV